MRLNMIYCSYSENYRTLIQWIVLWKQCRMVPTLENMYLFRDATGLRNMTVGGLSGTLSAANAYGTKRPTAGAYVLLILDGDPTIQEHGSQTRSYVQGVTTFGTGCVGLKVDGNLHNGGNDPNCC